MAKKKFISLLFVLWSFCASAFEIQLNSSGLSPAEIHSTQELINKAVVLLPPLLKSRLDKKIVVEYKDIKELGSSSFSRITLSSQFKAHVLAGAERSVPNTINSSRHKTVYDLALGTLVHEIAHQYDHHLINETNPYRTECFVLSQDNVSKPQQCAWYSFQKNISDDPRFLYSISWSRKEMKDRKILEEDDATARSPYAYEFKNSDEAFAVNMEFFLMDPEYKCRRPTGYEFLAQHFQFQPHANFSCQPGQNVLTSIHSTELVGQLYEPLDVNRIASIHYLLAGDGDAMMSQWGHSMIRLVICAPHRKVLDDECLKDVAYHRVVSYRAGVTDIAINTMKGITGGYPSRLYIMPLLNVIHEYTELELRELMSYPIQLSRAQIKNFIQRVTEQNWTYRGKYLFSTNNCATETFNIIRMVVSDNLNFANRTINTPKGLRDALLVSGLSQDIVSERRNENGPYYWSSKKNLFQKHIDLVSRESGFAVKDIREFVKLDLISRKEIFNRLLKSGKSLSSMYVLNRYVHQRLSIIRNAHIMNHEKSNLNSEVLAFAKDLISQDIHHGAQYFRGSYGIPFDQEIVIAREFQNLNQKNSEQTVKELNQKYDLLTVEILGQDFLNDLNAQVQMMDVIKDKLTNESNKRRKYEK